MSEKNDRSAQDLEELKQNGLKENLGNDTGKIKSEKSEQAAEKPESKTAAELSDEELNKVSGGMRGHWA